MRGRKPKPTALHKLHGTFNVTRHGRNRQKEPQPEGDLLEAPDGLTAGQRESWDYAIAHAPKGLLKKLDRGLLYAWVLAEDRLRAAEAEQQKFNGRLPLPYLIRTKDGLVISPYINIIDRATDKMIRLSDRLGFSPVVRPRIQVDQAPEGEDAADTWGELKRFPVIDGGKAR